MNFTDRHALLVGLNENDLDTLAPMLRREKLEIHTVEGSPFVLDLIRGTPFEVLIVGYPVHEVHISDMVAAAREPGSVCLASGILMVAEEDRIDEAMAWLDRGVNRIVTMRWPRAHIWRALGDLLEIAPRVQVDASVQVKIPSGAMRDEIHFRTTDISRSGALLTGIRNFPFGTQFNFQLALPDDGPPITGTAEVVRHTTAEREGVDGFAMRYLVLGMGQEERLDGFISSRISA